jgi:hypothetical protein
MIAPLKHSDTSRVARKRLLELFIREWTTWNKDVIKVQVEVGLCFSMRVTAE